MADITDGEAISFSDEKARPLSEVAVELKYLIDYANFEWNGGVSAMFSEVGDVLQDNRPADADLSGADMTNFMAQMQALKAVFDAPGVMDVITKLNVRTLGVILG